MNFELMFLAGLYAFSMFVGFAFLLQRWRWRRRRKGFYPRAGSLGNALHQLQTVVQPQVRYVVEEKLDEETGEDDAAEHLLRQARRIRRGEVVRLKVFWRE